MPQQWIDIPLPTRLNLDGGGTGLTPDESVSLLNVITNEAGQVRQRKGFTRQVGVTTLTAAGDLPVSVMTSPLVTGGAGLTSTPTRAIVTYLTGQSGVGIPYRNAWPNVYPTGYSALTASKVINVFVNADNPTSITAAALNSMVGFYGAEAPMQVPFGQTAQFDFSTIGASIGSFPSLNTKSGAARPGTRLFRWGGSNRTYAGPLVNTTLTLGSTAVTLASSPTPSLAGTFMQAIGGPAGSNYNYYVLSHTAGTPNVVLSKAYGLGDSTPIAGTTITTYFLPQALIFNSPPDVQCCGSYLSRLFVGRPTLYASVGSIQQGSYPHAIQWSDVNQPEKWTDTNIAVLDNNATDMIMGFATLRNMFVIFRRWSTWIMTGTDESSFTFQQVSSYGCLDCRSITNYQDGVFFMSDAGLIYYDGYGFTNITSTQPGHGIHTPYVSTAERFVNPESYPLSTQQTTILPRTDYLLMLGQDLETAATARHDQYLYHIPSRAWTRFNSANTDQVVLVTKPGQHLNNVATGFVGSEGLVNLDVTVEPEFMALGANQRRYDESYNASTDATTTAAVKSTIAFPDVRLNGGAIRLHRVILEHNIWKNSASAILGPDVFVGTDPFFGDVLVTGQSTTVGNVTPRYQPSETTALYRYRYSTELAGTTWPIEGSVIRVSVSTEFETLDTTNASHPPKYFGLRLLVEPTDDHMTDNPITS